MRRLLPFALCATCACAGRDAPHARADEVARFAVELTAAFETRGVGDAAALDLAKLDVRRQIDLVVATGFLRRFRDDSEGHLLVFESVIDRTGGDRHLPLEGRSVELRRFPNGEILGVDLAEHIVGGDRQGEIFDVVFPLISPSPPDLEEGASGRRTARWPLLWGDGQGWWNTAQLDWTYLGQADRGGRRLDALSYEGSWEIKGQDTAGGVRVLGKGRASGRAWFADDELGLVDHEFDWERSLVLRYEAAPQGPLELRQEQRFAGRARRVGAGVGDP